MDRINVDSLRTFLAVARHGHVGRAAEALLADQSTVSRKIARLEEGVGTALFGSREIPPLAERGTGGIV